MKNRIWNSVTWCISGATFVVAVSNFATGKWGWGLVLLAITAVNTIFSWYELKHIAD